MARFQDAPGRPSGNVRLAELSRPLIAGQRSVSPEFNDTFVPHGWNAAAWPLSAHAGTHRDTPSHSAAGPVTIGPPAARDLPRPRLGRQPSPPVPGPRLTVAPLGPVAAPFIDGESILLRTDWHRHASRPARYRDGLPRLGDPHAFRRYAGSVPTGEPG